MYIVRIHGSGGSIRYVLITGSPGGSSQAREQAEARLGPGEFAGIAVPASAQGISTMRRDAPDFIQQFGVDTSIDQIIQRLQAQATVVDGDGGFDGGGGDPVAATGPIVGTEDFGDLYPSFQAGLRERGIGIGPGGGVQGQLADAAFQNLRSRGFLDLALNAPTGTFGADAFADPGAPTQAEIRAAAGPTFQEFARTRGLYGGAGAGDALNLLNRAVALSKGRLPGFGEADELGTRANRFTDFNTGAYSDSLAAMTAGNPLTGAFLNPAQGGQAETDLARVAREAGRSRFGFASGFLPSAQQLSTSYFAQPQEGAMNFADFLRQRIFG